MREPPRSRRRAPASRHRSSSTAFAPPLRPQKDLDHYARTGKQLWQFRTGTGINSNPVTYSVGGKQYVAVPTGWGGWIKGFAPNMFGHERGSALFVFALP